MFRLIKIGKGKQTHSVEMRQRKNGHFHTYCGKDLTSIKYEDVGDGTAPTCMNCRTFARVRIPEDHKTFGPTPRPPMFKLLTPMQWLERMAALEYGHDISAGGP